MEQGQEEKPEGRRQGPGTRRQWAGGRGHWLTARARDSGLSTSLRVRGLRTSLGKGAGTWRQGTDPDLRARAREQEPGGKAQGPEGKDRGIEVWDVLGWLGNSRKPNLQTTTRPTTTKTGHLDSVNS